MAELPRITVVTPSFNQARYVEQTIRSVLDQNYPNLEYIVIDGGSTDESPEIIQRYGSRLAYWVSEKDRGQTHAINKGMERATGEIRAYLNSDDLYLPGTLQRIAQAYLENPGADLFHGKCRIIDADGSTVGQRTASIYAFEEVVDLWGVWWKRRNFVQPEVFWTRRIAEKIGPFREELYYVMDYEYWARMLLAGADVCTLDCELSCFRLTPTQKSAASEGSAREMLSVVRPYLWNSTAPLAASHRWKLQGEWLYQTQFLPAVEACLRRGLPRIRRFAALGAVVARHPKMLMSAALANRCRTVIGYRP